MTRVYSFYLKNWRRYFLLIILTYYIYTADTSKVGNQISGEPAERIKIREQRRILKFDLPNLEVSKVYAAVISFKVYCSFPNKTSSTNFSFIRCTLLLLLKFYQYFISPMLGNNCRFYPTCSEYAKEAIAIHGNIKGLWLTFKRIIKCQPFCDGGYDAVPPTIMNSIEFKTRHEE